ncbi:DUF1622 domain-containing protein [Amycolatopsis granulosa]|uniref:DUF1622 domain-containing protein n=1 Tax=Amycolatopsis granulosa TaxID=185684 RepID=UPI0014233AC8|nr:DUF1622 domain-containing protein [Amycolatopsis granulosa]NIH83891.1 putative membrane protein [Amycolatopsis granulosa]
MEFTGVMETVGTAVDACGVAVMVVGAVIGSAGFLRRLAAREELTGSYRRYRQGLGRAILLGLEFLVAGDIIRTVAISPTYTSVGVLAVIVAVRTFLSFSLEVELEGRWPWQKRRRAQEPG